MIKFIRRKTKPNVPHKVNKAGTKLARRAVQQYLGINNTGGAVSAYFADKAQKRNYAKLHPTT